MSGGSEFFDIWHDERLDSSEQLGFTIAADNPKAELVVEDAVINWGGRVFYIHETKVSRSGTKVMLDVRCNALWTRLGETKIPGSINLESVPTRDGLDTILAGTGWVSTSQTTNVSSLEEIRSMEQQDATPLALIRLWADLNGKFVKFDTMQRTVDVVATRGRDFGSAFRYARNLVDIERTMFAPSVTRLYPYGVDDLTVAGVAPGGKEYIEDFSFYTDQGISLEDAQALYTKSEILYENSIVDEKTLLAWAQSQLADLSQPEISYKCKVINLESLQGLSANEWQLEVGDLARVNDEPLGIDVQTTVTRYKAYPNEPWRDEVELSYLYTPNKPSSSSNSRPTTSLEWLMFKDDNVQQGIRLNGTAMLNRIGLRFREGGEAVYGYDLSFTGVGTGSLSVSAIDAAVEEDPEDVTTLLHKPLTFDFVDGQVYHENITWALKDLLGIQDVRIMAAVSTVNAAGSGASGGSVDEGADFEENESRLWILARGAVRESPAPVFQDQFFFNGLGDGTNGSVQYFEVPLGITEVKAIVVGAAGGQVARTPLATPNAGGGGAKVEGTFKVTPGEIIEVWVGGCPGAQNTSGATESPGWPNGGEGGNARGGSVGTGNGGGGSSHIVRVGDDFSQAIIVAGAGGGQAEAGGTGGDGTWHGPDAVGRGVDHRGDALEIAAGGGATQYSGGIAGQPPPAYTSNEPGIQGEFNKGANSPDEFGTNIFSYFAAGGGGGWYGGGSGMKSWASGIATGGSVGGGGSSWVDSDQVYNMSYSNGFMESGASQLPADAEYNKPNGYVFFEYDESKVINPGA